MHRILLQKKNVMLKFKELIMIMNLYLFCSDLVHDNARAVTVATNLT